MRVRTEFTFVIGHDMVAAFNDTVDALAIVRGDFHGASADVVEILFHCAWADQRAGDARLLHAPRQREL